MVTNPSLFLLNLSDKTSRTTTTNLRPENLRHQNVHQPKVLVPLCHNSCLKLRQKKRSKDLHLLGSITSEVSRTYDAGIVIEQNPYEGDCVDPQTQKVNLKIAEAPPEIHAGSAYSQIHLRRTLLSFLPMMRSIQKLVMYE